MLASSKLLITVYGVDHHERAPSTIVWISNVSDRYKRILTDLYRQILTERCSYQQSGAGTMPAVEARTLPTLVVH